LALGVIHDSHIQDFKRNYYKFQSTEQVKPFVLLFMGPIMGRHYPPPAQRLFCALQLTTRDKGKGGAHQGKSGPDTSAANELE